jgi:Putative adhesin
MQRVKRGAKLVSVLVLGSAVLTAAETRKEFHFTVGPHATISVTNQYGSVSVKPAVANQVTAIAILHSDKVEVDKGQSGNRVDLLSHLLDGANAENGRVEYELVIPADASIFLHSASGPLHAEGLHGDVTLEGASTNVDVREISDAHVHIKTLNGPITLTNIHDGHVEITSVSGNITLTSVSGPHVQANSTSGWIRYDGDFGYGGEYYLSSHSGNIDATAPQDASIDVTARSIRGKVENDFLLQPKHTPFVVKAGSAFAGTMNRAASSVKLFSFSGKIHLKKR